MEKRFHFATVSLLITHYNRPGSLKRLLDAFIALNCTFGEIVVSDDGSLPEHLAALLQLEATYQFRLIRSSSNKGLGNNINKGQDAVTTPFTLYVQEDFIPKQPFPERFEEALSFMLEDEGLDMVRFYAYFRYPFLKEFKNGYSKMIFSPFPWYIGYRKFYFYSDHPHLRRSSFLSKFGRYVEGVKVEATEYKMMITFLQKKGTALYYSNFQELFDQLNPPEEPSTVKRNYWRETPNPLVVILKHTYRYCKFNFDFNFR